MCIKINNSINLNLKLVNVQGLTKIKAVELEQLINNNTILCLTETQQKWQTVNFSNEISQIYSMRKITDRKGGGLMILKKGKEINIKKIESKSEDVLTAECESHKVKFTIILIYMSVNDNSRNKLIEEEVIKIGQSIEGKYIIMGDFNGHIGIIGKQKLNENGKRVLKISECLNLNILNCDLDCEGEKTWERDDQSSTIDFALINKDFYKHFKNMIIDEKEEKYDLSDHKLITINFSCSGNNINAQEKTKYKEIHYLKIDENTTKEYLRELNNKINTDNIKMSELETKIKEAANKTMGRTIKKKELNNEHNTQENKIEPIWFNEEIRKEIKKRKEYNRNWRNSTNEEEKERRKELYLKQKDLTKNKIKVEITKHEEKITKEIKTDKNNRKIWEHINKLRGKSNDAKKEVTLYDEEGQKEKVEDYPKKLKEFWETVYKKEENKIPDVWNNSEKEEYERVLKKT